MKDKIKNFFLAIFQFFVENVFFMGQKNLRSRTKALKIVINLAIVALAVSVYPLIRKGIKNL